MTDDVQVLIHRFVPGGWGIARDAQGLIFVRGAVHGELVRAKVIKKKGDVRFAQVVDVKERKEGRQAPDCDAHPVCGGCAFLDLNPAAEQRAKTEMLVDALSRIARLDETDRTKVRAMQAAPVGPGARRRASVVISREGLPSFFQELSNQTVPRAACAALAPELAISLAKMHEAGGWPPGLRVQLATDERGHRSAAIHQPKGPSSLQAVADRLLACGAAHGVVVLSGPGRHAGTVGDPVLEGVVAPDAPGGPYKSDASTFTQSSKYGARAITAQVLAALDEAKVPRHGIILELFAGAGHLTLPLAGRGANVVAVESDRAAINWLRANAARSGFAERVKVEEHFINGRSIEEFTGLLRADALVLDPPRTGVRDLKGVLAASAPPVLIMVSCDLATGARDLRVALDSGYRLSSLVPIDAFPRTHHLEWVATLRK